MPDGDVPGQRQYCQRKRQKHGHRLGHDEDAVAIPAVGEDAGEGGDEEQRHLGRKADDAQQERGKRQAVDKPAHGDLLHPGADE